MYGNEGVLSAFLMAGAIWNLLAFLLPLAVMCFIFGMVWKSRKQTALGQPILTAGMMDLQLLMEVLAQSSGNISSGQRTQFINAFHQAHNELNQLDDLRRQQSELRLGDMRAEAASMGLFLD